ncbi:MAG: hypothetical protein PHG20_06380, partial [Geobacteraceae bacterium]|nr:hypothetical protein [Geobacteraceae bacterium]
MPISGKNSALVDGQAVESSPFPVFEQFFDQAKASAAPADLKPAVDQTTESLVIPDVSVSSESKGTQFALATARLPLVEAAVVKNLAGKTVETPSDEEVAISSGSVDELTRLQTVLLKKSGAVLEGREPEMEKNPEKTQKNRSESTEGEMKVVVATPAAMNVQGLNVDDSDAAGDTPSEVTWGAIPARPAGQTVEVEEAVARPVVVETEATAPARTSQARPEPERTAGPAPVTEEATRMRSLVETAMPGRPVGQAVDAVEAVARPVVVETEAAAPVRMSQARPEPERTAGPAPVAGGAP